MQLYSQIGQSYSHNHIGRSGLTIGAKGCTICSIAMVESKFGQGRTPLEYATTYGKFTDKGLILWNLTDYALMKFVWRGYGFDLNAITAAANDPNRAVIVQVDLSHWIAVDRVENGLIIFGDPIGGVIRNGIRSRYRRVTGYATFVRK